MKDTDKVEYKFKKNRSLGSVKVDISGKFYKAKGADPGRGYFLACPCSSHFDAISRDFISPMGISILKPAAFKSISIPSIP